MSEIKSTSSNIWVKPIDKPISTLLIPPKYAYKAKQYRSGQVEFIGPKVFQVSVGDEVAYSKDGGTEVELDGQKWIVIKPKHLIGVV